MMKNIREIIKKIPHSPGCYKYFNKKGELIYVGKARDLKKRVSSYFVGANPAFSSRGKDPKTTVLVENIADIKWEVTGSEIEALILESLLIKKNKPRFNIKTKDDKDFLWVKIDLNQDFPMPELVRPIKLSLREFDGVNLFGPFTDSKLLKQGLAVLRKIFLWRDCSGSKFSFHKKRGKPCLEYYIKNCCAPCCGLVNANDYQLGIKQLIAFLEGKKQKIARDLKKEMTALAKAKRFEEAGIVRDKLRALEHMDATRNFQFPILNFQSNSNDQFSNVKKMIEVLNKELGYELKFKKNFRIEFYDISNTSGSEATGSMVVWQDGIFAKGQYRKFKIKTVFGIDDYKMMEEILARRIKRADWKLPSLFVMDGGKGQLGRIQRLFWKNNIKTPIISLAKKEEEVFGIVDMRFKKTTIRKNSPEGFFVQRLRDEAHRFAIGYHKVLREKKTIKSRLDEIEGVGPVSKKKLLLKFGSVDGIMKADVGEIAKVVGRKMAMRAKEGL